ncbi:pyridoxamine 5'-phosphate oxidase family protein [Ilumatobacter sp.]|uniref:pyridoxamine 5'-phosphate oxidase family protein n=1 Tax=Ilumatobacter sp. TaxID=1967498 RepID=UPI003B517C49
MSTMPDDEIDEFLSSPRDGVLSVRLASGRAMGTPIWFRWAEGRALFQSPTTSAKTASLRATGRASLCVHEQALPRVRYVTLEGPVVEVDFERDHIADAARHYLGDDGAAFMETIDAALDAGRRWASFELEPTTISSTSRSML